MKKYSIILKSIWLVAAMFMVVSCSNDDDSSMQEEQLPELTSGSADFSTYVSVGNSLTSGFTDGALFQAGQINSFPNLLAQKFSLVGGGEFTQPLTDNNIGGLLFGGQPNPRFSPRLYFNGTGPVRLDATPTTETFNILSGPFNNMGVPGAKSFHLLYDKYGNPQNLALGLANPYFVRFASAPDGTIIGDAIAQNPTFFSLWIGNQDILGYATTGGDGTDPITDAGTFQFAYTTVVTLLTSNGAKGVVANIPDITTIPHFTTVPFKPLSPANPAFGPQIPQLNSIFGAINQVYAFLGVEGRNITFSETAASAVVIKDETLTDLSAQIAGVLSQSPTFPAFVQQFGLPAEAAPLVANLLGMTYGQTRQATADDLLVLPVSSVIGTVNADAFAFLMSQGLPEGLAGQFAIEGITYPLSDKWVLIPSEQMEIAEATNTFNSIIASVASQAGLAFVDANAILSQIKSGGLSSNGFNLTSSLVTGGTFSLDGVHPTARGYALIANQFLKAIDATYGSNFEASGNLLDIGDYPTNYSPQLQ
ncbi:GDSL-like Lipase/Acylhydrolase [Flavobacteriaceae bacterium MAR_2010_188]|nr:GDSL-like Lipase/Acylhydrolase [Flavobacteriaceae bacterium MAR_2010_188]